MQTFVAELKPELTSINGDMLQMVENSYKKPNNNFVIYRLLPLDMHVH